MPVCVCVSLCGYTMNTDRDNNDDSIILLMILMLFVMVVMTVIMITTIRTYTALHKTRVNPFIYHHRHHYHYQYQNHHHRCLYDGKGAIIKCLNKKRNNNYDNRPTNRMIITNKI